MSRIFVKYIIFIALLVSIILFEKNNALLLGIITGLSIAMLAVDKFRLVKTFFGVAIFGSVSEMLVINFSDAWQYASDQFLGVPLWVFPMWGIVGLCFVTLAEFFDETKVK